MLSRCVHEGVRRGKGSRIRTIGEANERSQVVPRTPKLESDLCPPTCAFRSGADGGRGKVQTQAHIRWKSQFVFGTRRVLRTWSRECRAYVFLALQVCGAHLPIRAQAASDAPRASFNSATEEPKQVGHTHACHKAFVKGYCEARFCA